MRIVCKEARALGSIAFNQHADLYVGKLVAGGRVTHRLERQEHAWVQLIEGDLELNGQMLAAGDGASVDEAMQLHWTSRNGAHFLLFDLS
jgi:redox-sensitive bicupin YhaK (pirin superfamily)